MMKASRPKPKRAPAAKKAAAQKKKHKIFKPRRTRRKVAAKRASKRKPNAQAARKAAAIASLPGVVVRGRIGPRYAEILSRDALAFLAELHRRFDGKRRDLLAARAERQKRFDAGELPDFPPDTQHIRDNDSWRVAPIPGRSHRSAGGNHRPSRPQDDRQCAQFRRHPLHGRFRGREFTDLGKQY